MAIEYSTLGLEIAALSLDVPPLSPLSTSLSWKNYGTLINQPPQGDP